MEHSNLGWRNPADFGPVYWDVFHRTTAAYPTNFTTTDISLYSSFLLTYGYVLPCVSCAVEYAAMMNNYGPALFQALVRGKIYVWLWGVLVHNEVNARLNKPVVSPADIAARWGFAPCEADRAYREFRPLCNVSRNLQKMLPA